MFRIRTIHDDVSPANRHALAQITEIMRSQFPLASQQEIDKLPGQLRDPLKYKFRSIIFVAEDSKDRVKGFALFLHATDLNFCYLEFISVAPGTTGGGLGGILYERVREEALSLGVNGIFFECLPDEAHLVEHPELLEQNKARLRFYERYGARPVVNNEFHKPISEGDNNLFFLVYDNLGQGTEVSRTVMRKVARAILERKYGDVCDEKYIRAVVNSFQDDPIKLREPRYIKRKRDVNVLAQKRIGQGIALIRNEGHEIHHVRDRGYVEAPVRISSIIKELDKTGLFEPLKPRRASEKLIKAVHDPDYVEYLRRACEQMPEGKSIYPIVFPLRNPRRTPKDWELRAGYYCMDTFTPLNHNAYLAARDAVSCAVTGAEEVLAGRRFAYALVRPPGHHAERRAFGGFCYFNSAAVAANYLSRYGTVAVLDVDFHHGNGTQDIFYHRADVLTISIHGHPSFAYPHFAGFADESGVASGEGFNVNYPLAEDSSPERYRKTLERALKRIREYKAQYLVIALGLDTAKGDPTGTWALTPEDFRLNGVAIGASGLPTLFVQEGGYRTRTLGYNARAFFQGVWEGAQQTKAKKSLNRQDAKGAKKI
ncbi:MAG: histone deacetylase family protein [Gammaproteobacteria bacterium]|nr:histone deacetylase family protein [Gammaproteobacteria bacterium]